MTKKQFSELTPQGQKARLTKYAKQRAERGTTETLARLVRPATINDIAGGNKSAVFRFAVYNKEKNETDFFTASAFIAKDKVGGKLEQFYASLEKGQLVALEYKQNGTYTNVYNLIDRSKSDTRKKSAQPAQAVQVADELEA